ncbi:MAG: 16S rRNA (adenine(1518)-N(6)/adenine(1519)-N(6))-dimethyltransferase RsmA [Bacillota bacterium]|nr:16S rRNA (adenine(1518)-N(6)/adenine(1519)-N(6))-dimethyltransferase RsmA [Bacillota bacterium]
MADRDMALACKDTLRMLGLKPHSLRGQNYLIDEAVIDKIVAAAKIGEGSPTLEIGAGLGMLTERLLDSGADCAVLEIETRAAQYLCRRFGERAEIINADALNFDFAAYTQRRGWRDYQIVANLPYSITTPLLTRLLREGGAWSAMTLMLQKEAAQRLVAGKGRENGPLTLLLEYYAEAAICFEAPRDAFYPRPAVTSAVIDVRRRAAPPVAGERRELFRLIEAAFTLRRKTLLNALSAAPLSASREQWAELILGLGWKPDVRAEELSLAQFAELYAAYAAIC